MLHQGDIAYAEALSIVKYVAQSIKLTTEAKSDEIPLSAAVGRITAQEYVSPLTTPMFDSSAMDGFAIASSATEFASPASPVVFRVETCIAAGDSAPIVTGKRTAQGSRPCAEIMTGARFPAVEGGEQELDAVVKIEDVIQLDARTPEGHIRCIEVTQPVPRNAHRRFAGCDFTQGDLLIAGNETIRPHHVLALASVGIKSLRVTRGLKIGVWSTGQELMPETGDGSTTSPVMDANGPFLQASLQEHGTCVDFLGVIDDNPITFIGAVEEAIRTNSYDMLITTGAVSKGKFDFVSSALDSMGASVRFHGVSIRPGHPVLFATIPSSCADKDRFASKSQTTTEQEREPCYQSFVPFFGLPGNPIATAACLRFLVIPYLDFVRNRPREQPIKALFLPDRASIASTRSKHTKASTSIDDLDVFRHGLLSLDNCLGWTFQCSTEQSPAKMKPFAAANCWGHFRARRDPPEDRSRVDCFPL